jgi:LmbE family N-acetylglucosaminyl deacetylase
MPAVRPSFVVDITAQFEKKLKAILAYSSQFSREEDMQNLFPSRKDLRERVASLARHFGLMIGVRYGEPFVMREVAAVDDIVRMPVRSI